MPLMTFVSMSITKVIMLKVNKEIKLTHLMSLISYFHGGIKGDQCDETG